MSTRIAVAVAAAALALALPSRVLAVPRVLGYEGRLIMNGDPATGTPQVTFAIFSQPTGGTALWTEDQTLALTTGYYATYLGTVNGFPDGLFDGTDRYLELTVNGETLTPRQRISAVAYAMRSDVATSVSGGPVDATSLSINGVPLVDSSGHLAASASYKAGAGIAIDASNTISLTSTCAVGQVLQWSGSTWACATVSGAGGGISGVSVAVGTPITVANASTSPQLSMSQASATISGYLAASDWAAFSAKLGAASNAGGDVSGSFASLTVKGLQGAPVSTAAPGAGQVLKWDGAQWSPAADANSGGTLQSVSVASGTPISVASPSSAPQLSMVPATSTVNGYLAATDFATFSAKLGAASAAGGDVAGTFSNLTVKALQGAPVASTAATTGQVLKWDGAKWSPAADANSGGTVSAVSAASGTPITVSNGTSTPQLSMVPATSSVSGYLAATDFATFSQRLATTSNAGGDVAGTFASLTVKGLQGSPVSTAAPGAGQVLKWDGAQWSPAADANSGGTLQSVTAAAGTPIVVANGTSAPQLSMSPASATVSGYLAASDFATFSAKLAANASAGGDVSGNFASLTVKALQGAPVSPAAANSGDVLKWDGSKWAPAADANSGGTVSAVTVAAGTPIAVANGTSAPQLSMAQASASASGYLSSADWSAFSSKLGSTSSAGGDVSGSFSSLTVKALQGAPVSSSAAVSGQVLKWDGAQWSPAADANSGGTVSSVAVAAGTPITVANGTSAPTLSMSQASASASGYLSSSDWSTFNGKFGPSSTIGVSNGGTGAATLSPNTVLLGNGTNAISSVSGSGSTGQVLTSSGAGAAPTWQTPAVPAQITLQSGGGLAWSGAAGTGLGLVPSGVAAGSYTNASVSVDATGRLTAIASGANNLNASQILSVPVNDAAKSNGYVLTYNAQANQLVYAPNAAYGSVPGSSTAVWSSHSSGEIACTLLDSVCVSATSGANAIGCSDYSTTGQASCRAPVAADGWIVHASSSSSSNTGDMMCAALNTVCTQTFRASDGVTFGCGIPITGASSPVIARCRALTTNDPWNQFVTWNASYQTGRLACAAQGKDCISEVRADGYSYQCDISLSGSSYTAGAFCGPRDSTWDHLVTWTGTYQTGRLACGAIGEDCVNIYRTDGISYQCDNSISGGTYTAGALCTPRTGAWNQMVTWTGTYQTGDLACAQVGEDCVNIYRTDGISYTCDNSIGGGTYTASAFCKPRAGSWDRLVPWSLSNQTGKIACEQVGEDCVKVERTDAYAPSCDSGVGGGTYTAYAFCNARSTTWDSLATWATSNNTGDAACAGMQKVCVDGERQDGYTYPCQTDVGGAAGNLATARCRAPVASDGWDQAVPWTVSDNTGEAACTTAGKACARIVRGDGLNDNCTTDRGGTANTVYALCRSLTANDTWTTNVNWTGLSSTGANRCASIGKTCVTAFNADNGANIDCSVTSVLDGTARCK